MGTETEFLHVVDRIQAAALDKSLWSSALDSTADLMGGSVATTELIDIGQGSPVFAEFSERLNVDIVNRYMDYYSRINPRVADGIGRQAGAVRYDHAFLSEAEISRDEYYADFVRPLDLKYFVSGHIFSSPSHASLFTVQRSAAQGHVGDDEIRMTKRLIPHMRHALDVRIRLAKPGIRAQGFLYGLADLEEAAILVDRGGRILHANAVASALLSTGDGVTARSQMLDFSDRRAALDFAAALSSLVRGEGQRIDLQARSFPAPRPSGHRPYAVAVRALPATDAFVEALFGAAALVFIRDPDRYSALDETLLEQSYGLTRAETDLAAALDTGASLTEFAQRRGVSITTVRTQLYALMAKLGVNRQTDLVRLLRQYRRPF